MFIFDGGRSAVKDIGELEATVPPRGPLKLIKGSFLELGELRDPRGGAKVTEKPGRRRRVAVVCQLLCVQVVHFKVAAAAAVAAAAVGFPPSSG